MLQNAIIIALIVQFLHACTWDGMIFNTITERLWTLPGWVKKPLFGCPICMTPWWGSLILTVQSAAAHYSLTASDIVPMVLTLCIAAGINTVIVQLIPQHEAE